MTDSKLGTIVNDVEGKPSKAELNLDEAVIPIRVPNAIFDKFVKAAQFTGHTSVENWATALLVNSLTTKVGAPTIASPEAVSGQTANKITGPSNSGMVRRA